MISILLPTYNGAAFLMPQLQSIAAQTVGDHEVVIADDGSLDTTVAILREAASHDPRIRILHTAGNVGQKQRLHELAQAARHPLIAVADQDDVWHPDKLALLVAAMDETGADGAFGSSWIIDGEGNEKGYTVLDELFPTPAPSDRLLYLFKPSASAHAMVLRRPLFSQLSLSSAEPFDWLQSLDAVFAGGMRYQPNAITYHRVHGGNQSNASIGVRQSLQQRIRPANFLRYRNRMLADRWALTRRFEYLAYSPILSIQTRAAFLRGFRLCHDAWFSLRRGRALINRAFVTELMDLLQPFAGSEQDVNFAQARLLKLARATIHPLSIANDVGRAVLGRPAPVNH